MGTLQSKAIGVGAFFVLILLSGFWLSRSGRPLNSMIFTIHKLIAVGVVIFLVVSVHRVNQVAALSTIDWIAAAVTALFFLCTIATGGLLSINDEVPAAVLRMHQIAPYLTVLSTVWLLWQIFPAREFLMQ